MTKKLYFPPLLAAAFVTFLLFWILAAVTNANVLAEIIRAVSIPVAIAVVVAYAGDSLKALTAERPNGVFQLCLGVTCNWVGAIGTSIWVLLFRLSGQPMWMLHADLPNMFATLGVFGAVLHITAPGAIYGTPKKSMVVTGVTLGAMVLVLIGVISLHPNMRSFTDRLRPYLEDRTMHPDDMGDLAPGAKRFEI